MRRITVFADGRTMEWTISTGQRVSFKRIVGDKVIEVPEGRILDENARTITAGYEYLGGLFRNRMLKGSAVILRPVIGKKDTYHVDKWVRGLGLGSRWPVTPPSPPWTGAPSVFAGRAAGAVSRPWA